MKKFAVLLIAASALSGCETARRWDASSNFNESTKAYRACMQEQGRDCSREKELMRLDAQAYNSRSGRGATYAVEGQ